MTSAEAKPVIDGRRVRWTLEQIEQGNPNKARIDWLRFTMPLDAVVQSEVSKLPKNLGWMECLDRQGRDTIRLVRGADADLSYSSAPAVAHQCAEIVAGILGFEVGQAEDRGTDFYTARTALIFEGKPVGMCLSGGKSQRQASTVHVNLYGAAMLHVSHAKLLQLKTWIDQWHGWITRVDLALDVWEGHAIQEVRTAYLAGEFDVRGKRPNQQEAGSWTLGHSRTFYVGSRDSGKLFRAYEKGDEQFGHESNDPWIRYEVEIRNNQRVIATEVLERPADFFAGAYAFCERVIAEVAREVEAETILTHAKLIDKSAEAAAVRVVRWAASEVGATIAVLMRYGQDTLAEIASQHWNVLPRRMQGFAMPDVVAAFEKVAGAFVPAPAPLATGT